MTTLAMVVSIVSAAVAVGAFIINGRSTIRKDVREDTAETLRLKDERIDELEQKVERLQGEVEKMPQMQSDLNAVAAKVRVLEKRVDEYGCWSSPHCDNRKPLSGPNPHGDI